MALINSFTFCSMSWCSCDWKISVVCDVRNDRWKYCLFFLTPIYNIINACRTFTGSIKKTWVSFVCVYCQNSLSGWNHTGPVSFVIFLIPGGNIQSPCYHISWSWCIHHRKSSKSFPQLPIFFHLIGFLFFFVIAKYMKNGITWGNWEVITISLEVNLRKEEAYSPLFQSYTDEVVLGLQWKQRRLHSACNWYPPSQG